MSNGEAPAILKVCVLCGKTCHYDRGDRMPHWGLLSDEEKKEKEKYIHYIHHTLCPKCKKDVNC